MHIEAKIYDNHVEEVLIDGQPTYRLDSNGHCRQVFSLNDKLFIKFDNPNFSNDETGIQTMLELENVGEIKDEDKKYFCLPLAWGEIDGLWYTVQEGVKDERYPTPQDVAELNKILVKYKLVGDVGSTEWGNHNCALTKDGWKIYDYALKD